MQALIRMRRSAILAVTTVSFSCAVLPTSRAGENTTAPVKIAVFDFELDDISAAAVQSGGVRTDVATMQKVSEAARKALSESGRYTIVDASQSTAKAVTERTLRSCDGCEAGIALQLGADQAMFGTVRKVSMTDYYAVFQISDAHTGRVIDRQEANFAGSEEGWPTGVRMLIKHQLLEVGDAGTAK